MRFPRLTRLALPASAAIVALGHGDLFRSAGAEYTFWAGVAVLTVWALLPARRRNG